MHKPTTHNSDLTTLEEILKTRIEQSPPDSAETQALIQELDAHLGPQYPSESRHGYCVDKLLAGGVIFFIVRVDGHPAGCCGIELFGKEYGEVKRMYVRPPYRGMGLGRLSLDHLSEYAARQNIGKLKLETGIYQEKAIRLYEGYGFQRIPPFGPYKEDPLSLFFEKRVQKSDQEKPLI